MDGFRYDQAITEICFEGHSNMTKAKKIYDASKGKKTVAGSILYLIMRIVITMFPNAIDEQTQQYIYYGIDILIGTGILDKLWRNRHKITEFIHKLFTKKQN